MITKGKIVKRTTWSDKTKWNDPERIVMVELENTINKNQPYVIFKQRCKNKGIDQCEKESVDQMDLRDESIELNSRTASVAFDNYMKEAKKVDYLKNIRSLD